MRHDIPKWPLGHFFSARFLTSLWPAILQNRSICCLVANERQNQLSKVYFRDRQPHWHYLVSACRYQIFSLLRKSLKNGRRPFWNIIPQIKRVSKFADRFLFLFFDNFKFYTKFYHAVFMQFL